MSELEKCFICLENKNNSNLQKLTNCGHSPCTDCFVTHCRVSITNNFHINPKCPICRNNITSKDVAEQWKEVWNDAETYQERRSLHIWKELNFWASCLNCYGDFTDVCNTIPCRHSYEFCRNCESTEEETGTCKLCLHHCLIKYGERPDVYLRTYLGERRLQRQRYLLYSAV